MSKNIYILYQLKKGDQMRADIDITTNSTNFLCNMELMQQNAKFFNAEIYSINIMSKSEALKTCDLWNKDYIESKRFLKFPSSTKSKNMI